MAKLQTGPKERKYRSVPEIELCPKSKKRRKMKLRKLKSSKYRKKLKHDYQFYAIPNSAKELRSSKRSLTSGTGSLVVGLKSLNSLMTTKKQNLRIYFGGVQQEELEGKMEYKFDPKTVSDRHMRRWEVQKSIKQYNSERMLFKFPTSRKGGAEARPSKEDLLSEIKSRGGKSTKTQGSDEERKVTFESDIIGQ